MTSIILVNIGLDTGLVPVWCQAIMWIECWLTHWHLDPSEQTSVIFQSKYNIFSSQKIYLKISLKCQPFSSSLNVLTLGVKGFYLVNPLAPGRSGNNSKVSISNSLNRKIAWVLTVKLWMPQNLSYEKSTLVQVMAWCRQAPSHYLN